MEKQLSSKALLGLGLIAGLALGSTLATTAGEETPARPAVEELRRLAEAINAVKENFIEPVDTKTLIEGAIRGMANSLDAHSAYIEKEEFASAQRGPTAGLGLELGMQEGLARVVSAIENTPASRGGLKRDDLILKIDDTEVLGKTLTQVVARLRGDPDTPVTLTLRRKDEGKPLAITLKREVIHVQTVRSKWLESGYAWLGVTSFQERTAAVVAQHLRELCSRDALRGLILDLRNNPGGQLPYAIAIAAAFLRENSVVVSTDGRIADARHTFRAAPEDYAKNRIDPMANLPPAAKTVPLVVLVNGKSAAGAEIVSAALQDHRRALIVGTPTFGQTSIQTVLQIPNGAALKLTTARWSPPNGRSGAGAPIIPDVPLRESAGDDQAGVMGSDRQLTQALIVIKELQRARQ